LEKFLKHFVSFGKEMVEQCKETSKSVGMINSETDLKIFIDESRT
jgi:hypothetical protein